MSDHQVEILAYLDKAAGVCSCGFYSGEKTGDRRSALAKQAILVHLEAAIIDSVNEFQIKDGKELKCPHCKSDLDLKWADKGLLSRNSPSVVACEKGDEFDAYYQRGSLFLFVRNHDEGPFST
jgi:hypothetical protein